MHLFQTNNFINENTDILIYENTYSKLVTITTTSEEQTKSMQTLYEASVQVQSNACVGTLSFTNRLC